MLRKVILKEEWLLAFCGLLVMSLMFYPGFINGDSRWQLQQALSQQYNTHHPVIMAWVWSWLLKWAPESSGIFVLHTGLFWMGVSILIHDAFRTHIGRILGLAFFLGYLPLAVIFTIIGKDSGLTGAMVLATALLARQSLDLSRWRWLVLITVLTYAFHVRHNGWAAVLPFWVGASFYFPRKWWTPRRPALRHIYAYLLTGFLIVVPWKLFEKTHLRPVDGRSEQLPMLFDIVAVSFLTGKNYLPEFYNREGSRWTLETLKPIFNPYSDLTLFWPPAGMHSPGWIQNDQEYVKLLATWQAVIWTEPIAYLKHRCRLFGGLLGIAVPNYWPYWFPWTHEWPTLRSVNFPFKQAVMNLVTEKRSWPIFKAWFYLLLIIIFFSIALKTGSCNLVITGTTAMSALLNECSYFFMVSSTDFRFSFWLMGAALIMPLILYRKLPPRALEASNTQTRSL